MGRELRGDVQGLRAVAVLVVIAAHAGVPFLPGGFVGVDMFYVISGYLIAALLYREVTLTGKVSLGSFWARRARRILPAATLVTVVTTIAAIMWMSLLDARQVVIDALWASAFAANIHFAQQGVDYFAQVEGPSPLQHYWSLAVEEQFYVLWPLLLAACLGVTALLTRGRSRRVERLPRRAVLTMLVLVSVASLAWSIHATVASPETAYFSTLTRAWELGVGAMIALVPPTFVRRLTRLSLETMAVTGAVVLLAGAMLITPETPFPGPLEDCYTGLRWLHAHAADLGVDPARIALRGESAGGGLAAALALLARDRGEVPLAFQCLVYPMLDDRTGASGEPHPHAGKLVWTAASNRFGWQAMLGRAPGGLRRR